ncbi:sodium-dependent glucose transporter 1-like isoform X1 [Dreissena polymorpha]|nr:sodium-dependent glucose transporter 1-like isoform X1 [Dreissena polymorpha]
MKAAMTSRRDYHITIFLFLAWVTKGLYLEALGPAMIDLKLLYKTNYESVTRAVAGRGVGGFLGAVVGAFVVDKYQRHLDLCCGVSTSIAGLCVAMVTYVPSIDYVWLLYCVLGCCSNLVNIAGTKLTLDIWREKSSTLLQLLHMGYSVGALLGPIICTPYLAVVQKESGEHQFRILKETQVDFAFLLIGLSTVAVALPFFYFHYFSFDQTDTKNDDPDQKTMKFRKSTWRDKINPAFYANGDFTFRLAVLTFFFVYFFTLVGGEKTFMSFVRTISVDVFKFDKTDASMLNILFWVCFTAGRLTGSFVSHFVQTKTLLIILVSVNAISSTFVNVYGLSSVNALWFSAILQGFVISPLYPLGVAYGNTLVTVSGFCLMVIVFAGSFGDMTYLWIAGRLYDTYGAGKIFVIFNFALCLLALTVWAFQLFIQTYRKSSKKIRSLPLLKL